MTSPCRRIWPGRSPTRCPTGTTCRFPTPATSGSSNDPRPSTPRSCSSSTACPCDTLDLMVNPSTAQARVVVDELIRGGVRDVVLCPGSRNAPLAFALRDADAPGRMRLHVRIDERTAGYLAIGLAVAGQAPVAIVMTSGTAGANLGPAVTEANYARVPLIVLSANRPYELLGTGANQTMEQLGLFGTQVRSTVSLGLAEEGTEKMADQNARWRSAVCRVLVAATGARSADAGPVQFDIPMRDPLVPDRDPGPTPPGRPGGKAGPYTPGAPFAQPPARDVG